MQYYYFAASLPALNIGDEPPVSVERFKFLCEGNLAPADMAEVFMILDGHEDGGAHAFMLEWNRRETQLRNAVARIRAARAGLEAGGFQRHHDGFDVGIEKAAADAMGKPDPLEREMALDRFRWKTADEMAAFDPFGMPAIMAFAFKLRLAWRWAAMKDEKGAAAAEKLIEKTTAEKGGK